MTEQQQNRRTPADERMHTLRSTLAKMQKEIAAALPRHVNQERFLRIMLTTVRRNPRLLECSTVSVVGAMMAAAQGGGRARRVSTTVTVPRPGAHAGPVEVPDDVPAPEVPPAGNEQGEIPGLEP